MKKIYIMVLLLSFMVGCQSSKQINEVVPKKQDSNYTLYRLYIENNAMVYTRKIEPISYQKEFLFSFTHKASGKLLFKMNNKTYIDIKIPKKKLTHIYTVISKKGNSEKLLGEFKIDVVEDEEPYFAFISYVYMKKNEIDRYNRSKKPKEESTYSGNWAKVWDVCGGDIALKKDGSLWQFGDVTQCTWGEIDLVDSQFMKRNIYTYFLEPKKIATGFKNAKFINGGDSFYLIKRDGTVWNKSFNTPLKQIGKDSDWVSVGVDTGVHDGLDYDIGLKKDGSLWKISKNKTTSLSKYKGWDKVWIDCVRVYAQKKDGQLWSKVSAKDEFKKIDGDAHEIFKIMEKIPSKKIGFIQYTKDINFLKEGKLFLAPKINTEELQKNRSITIHPSHKKIVDIKK